MTTPRFFKWLFRWQIVRRALVGLAVLVTLIALFYTEENIRGRRAWEQYRREAEARGEQFDWRAFIPKPVPDDQNFAATPVIQSWFPRSNRDLWKDNYSRAPDLVKIDRDHRNIMDLVTWARAFAETNANGKVESGPLDKASRAQAAPAVLEALKTNETLFAELRVASQRPYSRYPIDYQKEDPFSILLPHLNGIRQSCRRLQLKACAELAADQSDAALEDIKLIFRLVDSLKEEPIVISHLVRCACLQTAIQPIWEGLAEHAWSEAQLQELQTRLQSYNFVADLKSPLDAERAAGVALIDFSEKRGVGDLLDFVGTGKPNSIDKDVVSFLGRIVPSGWWSLEEVNYCRLFGLQLTGTYDGANKRIYRDRIESNADEFEQALAGRKPFDTIFLHHRLMSTILLPELRKIPVKAAVVQAATDQALLACALERYRLANGQFPDTLDTLAPRFISSLPHDVLSGEPYKYRRTDDGQFALSSVGWIKKADSDLPGNEFARFIKNLFDGKESDWVWQYPSQ
jgi:hypothetical protein